MICPVCKKNTFELYDGMNHLTSEMKERIRYKEYKRKFTFIPMGYCKTCHHTCDEDMYKEFINMKKQIKSHKICLKKK